MSTKIPWCDEVWNPTTGCSPVSEGCQNCYARQMAQRLKGRFGYPADDPFRVTLHYDRLYLPLKWKKPRMVFVNSMGDLFHYDVNKAFIVNILKTIFKCPQHVFIVLTKRPERAEKFFKYHKHIRTPNNLWLGVSVENQQTANERIPVLLQIPAAKRFVSVEPMLESISFRKWIPHWWHDINWVICGQENGKGARPFDLNWARLLRDKCYIAGVPFFYKGKNPPQDLKIQEWPE